MIKYRIEWAQDAGLWHHETFREELEARVAENNKPHLRDGATARYWLTSAAVKDGDCLVLGVTRQTLQAFDFPNGMTVAELKAMVRDWPETDERGEPCEVWLADSRGLSNQARMATPLNKRQNKDGTKLWTDFMLGHDGAG